MLCAYENTTDMSSFYFSGPWQWPEDVFGPMRAAEGVLRGLSDHRTWNSVKIPAESSH